MASIVDTMPCPRVMSIVTYEETTSERSRSVIKTENAEVVECTCERCGYVWFAQLARNEKGKIAPVIPIACAHCKSAYWQRPRLKKGKRNLG